MKSRLYVAVRVLFALVGLAFIGVALASALRDPDLSILPSTPAIVTAVVVVVVGLWAAVAGWARLLGSPITRSVARGFLFAQLGKYVPGGVWQVVGQVGHATSATDVGGRRAALAYLMSVVAQVSAGLLVGLPIVVVADVPAWIRVAVVAAAAVSFGLILQYRVLRRIILALPWIRSASPPPDDLVPSRGALLYACGTSVISMLAAATVFVIAYQAPIGTFQASAGPAYALAWTIGFLALPFPAGLGIREAALLLLLPGGATAGIVAASAVVRVIYIVGELVAIVTALSPPAAVASSTRSTGPHDEVGEQADGEDQQPGDQQ